jgi:hypothetical protein
VNVNRVPGAREPLAGSDGTASPAWYRFFAALAESVSDSSSVENGPMTPYFVAADETFVVPVNKQALFSMPIDSEGILDIEGYLLEVD